MFGDLGAFLWFVLVTRWLWYACIGFDLIACGRGFGTLRCVGG